MRSSLSSEPRVAPTVAIFVQNNLVDRITVPVAKYAHSRGICLEDRSSTATFNPDDCGIDWTQYDTVLPYGSVQFIRHLKKSSLAHNVLHDEVAFSASSWAPLLGNAALNSGGSSLLVSDIAGRLEDGPAHIRPDFEDKAFNGQVFTQESWLALVEDNSLRHDLACWISPIQDITGEWRCWIIAGQVVEISQYRKDNMLALRREDNADSWTDASRLSALYQPAPCYVMDMAKSADGQTRVLEYNPIHCSGWYAADIATVMDAWVLWAKTRVA